MDVDLVSKEPTLQDHGRVDVAEACRVRQVGGGHFDSKNHPRDDF